MPHVIDLHRAWPSKRVYHIVLMLPENLFHGLNLSSNFQKCGSTTKDFICRSKYLIITNELSPLYQYQCDLLISKMASNSMENIPKKVTGGCLCGIVRYEINFSPEHDWQRGVNSLPCKPFPLQTSSTDYCCSLIHANVRSVVKIVAA